ncbi:MAG TPA: TetR/AcrR family transcriptional regulator [Solirubrobacteraceae bacterium]|nr:TetR/AcrR family transcriptional regulator [Solirubrobacteraceae bacterium]
MPKLVDHDQRRRELGAAVWRVICARGPEAVTIRDVAAEAGWSSGALRHYLPTREELLVFAFRLAGERATERIRAAGDAPVERILEEAMPLDEPRRQEALIWFAFVGLAPSQPTLAAELDRVYRDIVDRLAARIGDRERASVLFAVVDGITVQALAMPSLMTPERQRAALRSAL